MRGFLFGLDFLLLFEMYPPSQCNLLRGLLIMATSTPTANYPLNSLKQANATEKEGASVTDTFARLIKDIKHSNGQHLARLKASPDWIPPKEQKLPTVENAQWSLYNNQAKLALENG